MSLCVSLLPLTTKIITYDDTELTNPDGSYPSLCDIEVLKIQSLLPVVLKPQKLPPNPRFRWPHTLFRQAAWRIHHCCGMLSIPFTSVKESMTRVVCRTRRVLL